MCGPMTFNDADHSALRDLAVGFLSGLCAVLIKRFSCCPATSAQASQEGTTRATVDTRHRRLIQSISEGQRRSATLSGLYGAIGR